MQMQSTSTRGFTLVELMIVVAIIGILGTIGTATYFHYIDRAKDSEVLTMLGQASRNAAAYYETEHVI